MEFFLLLGVGRRTGKGKGGVGMETGMGMGMEEGWGWVGIEGRVHVCSFWTAVLLRLGEEWSGDWEMRGDA